MNKSWRNVVIGEDSNNSAGGAGSANTSTSASASASATSGNSPTPSVTSSLGTKIPVAAENDGKRYERLLIVYAPLVGQRVTVFLYDGAVFEGTLDSFVTEKAKNEFALILRMATMLRPGREVIDASIKAGITFELMNIRFDDMAELKSNSSTNKTGGIGTDAAISKKKAGDFGKERELHRWLPEESNAGQLPSLATNAASSNWDQFATNEKLFGLKTDFNEEMYTTKLDRSSAQSKANEAKAERIAKEIMMASSGGNAHLAEERGHEGTGDEEMLYGAVIREQSSLSSTLPPGFTQSSSQSSLNPSAPEFKLNIDAPEFNPSAIRVTYYNQPRRNLNYNNNNNYNPNMNMNGFNNGYYGGGGYGYPQHPHQVPYYYVPPVEHHEPETVVILSANSNSAHSAHGNGNSNSNGAHIVHSAHSVQSVQSTHSEIPVTAATTTTIPTSTTTTMNPNAADFVMPQQPQYYQQQQPTDYYGYGGYNNSGYGNGNGNGYYNNYYNQ